MDNNKSCNQVSGLLPTINRNGNNFTAFHPAALQYPSIMVKVDSAKEANNAEFEYMDCYSLGPGPPIVTGEQLRGPKGCNLFVFHLPNDITNWDLYVLFRRYGTILSVHVMINKLTGLSRGYGFVSYLQPQDAQHAISIMNGFRLGKKRLKVQQKRFQDDLALNENVSEWPHDKHELERNNEIDQTSARTEEIIANFCRFHVAKMLPPSNASSSPSNDPSNSSVDNEIDSISSNEHRK